MTTAGVTGTNANLATHEILEVLEILSMKNVCLTKSATMQTLVTDPQLKTLLQQDVQSSKQAIQELQTVLQKV
jgi:similar to spore coat protein